MNKIIFTISIGLIIFLTSVATQAIAATNCQPVYGGGQTCVQAPGLQINKEVSVPQGETKGGTDTFVDNLDMTKDKFGPDNTVKFRLTVTNTGSNTLSKVTVKDIFPSQVNFVAGPGNFDNNSRTLTFDVANLNPGESRSFIVTGKIVSTDKLSMGVNCDVVNQAIATSPDISGQSVGSARFCVQKQPVPGVPSTTKGGLPVAPAPKVTTTPSTGPESLVLMALMPLGALGTFLRRKAAK